MKRIGIRSTLLSILLWAVATPAGAVTIFGRATVKVDGFKGYRAELVEGLEPVVEEVRGKTLADGFFRINTMSIVMYGSGPVRWPESERNQIKFVIGRYKVAIPTDWIGWKVGDRVFLQPITCIVDPEGGAYCDHAGDKKEDLLSRYALRFGISGMRRLLREPEPPARPEEPDVVGPSDEVVKPIAPTAPVKPARPAEPEIYGPTD